MSSDVSKAHTLGQRLIENIERVIVDKDRVIRQTVTAVLVGGHILFEDVPGVGKTMLCRALAKSIGGKFSRLQCTPDLLPSDLLGVTIYERQSGEFKFRPGPVFSNLLLADEVNRATPKMQSALLECMEEHQATVGGTTHPLPEPFIVVATQNPIEYEGTFPLPEAQLDRFSIKLRMGYPSPQAEAQMLEDQQLAHPLESLEPICQAEEIRAAMKAVHAVHVEANVRQYIVAIVDATRCHPQVLLGASPRASQTIYRLAQAQAVLDNRNFVIPDDVQSIAPSALSHRLLLRDSELGDSEQVERVVAEILAQVKVP